jgi:hypothetical protein
VAGSRLTFVAARPEHLTAGQIRLHTRRRDFLLACSTAAEAGDVMADMSQLRVVPLLQALLFDS